MPRQKTRFANAVTIVPVKDAPAVAVAALKQKESAFALLSNKNYSSTKSRQMSLYTVSKNDIVPSVPLVKGLRMEASTDTGLLSALMQLPEGEVIDRLANDHLAFVAYYNEVPAAFGWMATGKARIGELNHEFVLPVGNAYLWNFRTMDAYRGLGIYPVLLQYIIKSQCAKFNRFWIIHAPENQSSLRGIQKAGFVYTGKLGLNGKKEINLEVGAVSHETRSLLEEMGLRINNGTAASCWNCSSPYLRKRQPRCCCSEKGMICSGADHLLLTA